MSTSSRGKTLSYNYKPAAVGDGRDAIRAAVVRARRRDIWHLARATAVVSRTTRWPCNSFRLVPWIHTGQFLRQHRPHQWKDPLPPRETTERHRSRMSVVNEDFLDCAMVSSGVTVVVASVQEHSARVVRHLPHPNSMSLPIVLPHLLLHTLLTSSDHAIAAFQIQASIDFWQSAPP